MALKIAYVAFIPRPVRSSGQWSTGVEKNLLARARAFAETGAEVDVMVASGLREGRVGPVELRRISNLPALVVYPFTVYRRFRLIERAVDLTGYELVILRYPAADPSGPGFARRVPLVTEHHTRTLAEMQSIESAGLPLPEKAMKSLRLTMERRYGPKTLRECRGLIGVTSEIVEHESARAGGKVPSVAIPNGIDVRGVPHTGFRPFSGDTLHVVFLAASLRPWHGLDRLTRGLSAYDGGPRIKLHLIGNIPRTDWTDVSTDHVSTEFHGTLAGEELDAVLRNANLAVSSLGLHRNQMREASTLKTREYMARGLPFLIGHEDPDLSDVSAASRFFLSVPADDSPIDIERVIEFASRTSRGGESGSLADEMRHHAVDHMDWASKTIQYLEFCERVLHSE